MAAKLSVLMRSSIVAFEELSRAFGRLKALQLLGEVGKRNAQGLPFKHLPPPGDEREAETRAELVPAVNLYQVLLAHTNPDEAFLVARRVILNSSLLHLRSIYPDFVGGDFSRLTTGGSSGAEARLGADFAFADTRVLEMSEKKASFDVVHCRIPDTLRLVGAEKLAAIFCEVDFIYFPIFEPKVKLERTKTLILGGDVCDFRLTWQEDV